MSNSGELLAKEIINAETMNASQPLPVSTDLPMVEGEENAASEGYQKAYKEMLEAGWNPRKARRYLDSIAKRNMKKFIKNNKGKIEKLKQQMNELPTNEGEENEI